MEEAITLDELMLKLPLERRERLEREAQEEIALEMTLREIRKNRDLSQESLADLLGWRQGEISRLERKHDFYLSTIRRYIEALGGELELIAVFPDCEPIKIEQLGDLDSSKLNRRVAKKRRIATKGKAQKIS